MLNQTTLLNFCKHSIAVLKIALILPILTSPSNASEVQNINFYLPSHSAQFPSLSPQLQQAFISEGLNNITVKHADYWQQYQQNIRRGQIGIYYAPPHFTAWVIEKHNFKALLKVKNNLKYVIASKQANEEIFEIRDLKNKDICTRTALNLDYLLVINAFEKNLQTANTNIAISPAEEMFNPNSQCSAFSISEHFFVQLQLNQPNHFIRLFQGTEYQNYAISIHPSLDKAYSAKLSRFLTSEHALKILSPLLKLSTSSPTLLKAKEDDYSSKYAEPLKRYWRE